jgi:hypothetical protein
LSPWTTRRPRLTWASDGNPRRRLLIGSKKTPGLGSRWWAWDTSNRKMGLLQGHAHGPGGSRRRFVRDFPPNEGELRKLCRNRPPTASHPTAEPI